MNDDHLTRQTVAQSSRILAKSGGGDLIWGHVSARDPEGRGLWLKQASFGLEEITPERVHLLSLDGDVLTGGGKLHVEWPIHAEIMKARPEIGGVVHIHSRHAVALAATGSQLLPISHEANLFSPHGVPAFDKTADLILTTELGQAVADALGEATALFLVNHGVVCVGPDLETATVAAIILERACEMQLLADSYGGPRRWSDAEESDAKKQHIYPLAQLHAVWDYLERTVA